MITIADIDKVQEEVSAKWAQEAIDKGSTDPMNYWLVAYHKGTPEQREELLQVLREYNQAIESLGFGF